MVNSRTKALRIPMFSNQNLSSPMLLGLDLIEVLRRQQFQVKHRAKDDCEDAAGDGKDAVEEDNKNDAKEGEGQVIEEQDDDGNAKDIGNAELGGKEGVEADGDLADGAKPAAKRKARAKSAAAKAKTAAKSKAEPKAKSKAKAKAKAKAKSDGEPSTKRPRTVADAKLKGAEMTEEEKQELERKSKEERLAALEAEQKALNEDLTPRVPPQQLSPTPRIQRRSCLRRGPELPM